MKVLPGLENAYIERNARILREFAEEKEKGKRLEDIYPALSKRLEVSKGLIHSVLYHPEYAYFQEARDQIKEELKTMEENGQKISLALAKLVSYEPVKPKLVPNC